MRKLLSLFLCVAMVMTSVAALAEDGVFQGEADGFAGPVVAEVTVTGGVITDLKLTGEAETPEIGGKALEPLREAILAAGTVDGVDSVTGATWTSTGVFNAIKNALGLEEAAEAEAEAAPVNVSGLRHGLGVVVTPRLGPGKDDQEVPVYSFNAVIAYVLSDAEGRIVDAEADILEIITPNHDGAEDNALAGWPGAIYNEDADGDGKVEGQREETTESFTAELPTWKTKRQLGSAYKMNSGTWTQEMDIFENFFKGKTAEELQAFFDRHCAANGRVIRETATNEEDLAKWNALTDAEKADVDALSGATMSLSDAHGDILGAIVKALNNQEDVAADDVAGLGLGVVVTPRLGPGKDDQEVPVYSFNEVVAGTLLGSDGKLAAVKEDILEIITPNHDGANDNVFIGWPGQSYNSDDDGDGKVNGVAEQTAETFTETLPGFRTKRDLGNLYKMNSGTWTQEMNVFEAFFQGKTAEEIRAFFEKQCAANGRVIRETATKEEDLAKWNALTDAEKANVDALSGATMSLSDAHGDLLGALEAAVNACKPCAVTLK